MRCFYDKQCLCARPSADLHRTLQINFTISSRMTTQSGLSLSKMTADGSRRRMLKDNSWIRRDAEEDEAVDYDPNFGRSVLGRLKSSDDDDSTAVTSVSSVTKRYGGSQDVLDKSDITMTTKSSVTTPTSPSKPPVPAKGPALKTSPNTSAFTARVFSGANSTNKTIDPVKRSFGEKTSEVTVYQTANRLENHSSAALSSPVIVSPSPVSSSVTSSTSTIVKSSSVKSPIRTENVSFSYDSPTSSVTTTNRKIVTNSSSLILEETRATTPSENFRLNDVSYSSTHTTPSSEILSTYSYSRSSVPLDDLADTLIPTRSGSVQSQPVQSQTHMMSYNQSFSTPSQMLYSPTKTTFSEFTSTSRSVGGRDVCSICGKSIAGAPRMILEDLKIFSHTSCFKCAVCQTDLGNLEAGKSLWVHRDRVNCFNCYSKIKGQWYI